MEPGSISFNLLLTLEPKKKIATATTQSTIFDNQKVRYHILDDQKFVQDPIVVVPQVNVTVVDYQSQYQTTSKDCLAFYESNSHGHERADSPALSMDVVLAQCCKMPCSCSRMAHFRVKMTAAIVKISKPNYAVHSQIGRNTIPSRASFSTSH